LWRDRDKRLLDALSKPVAGQDHGRIDVLRKEIADIERQLFAAAARIDKEFPEFAALTNQTPLNLDEVQKLLGEDEALVFFLTGDKESNVFAVTRDGFEWKAIPLGAEALDAKVVAFRRGLNLEAVRRGLEGVECTRAEADKRGQSYVGCGRALASDCEEAKRGLQRAECAADATAIELFNLGLAHELYDSLIGPVEVLIRDKRHLLVVSSGALAAVPFHLLVTEKPAVAVPRTSRDLAAYRDAAWLLKRHAVSVLPSVASLKALRVFARKDFGSKPMIGFGDPIFGAEAAPEAPQRAAEARAVVTRAYSDYWEGAGIDRTKLARALPRLADTADELKAVARKLGAPAGDVKLRKEASETNVKRMPLRRLFRHSRSRRGRHQGPRRAIARSHHPAPTERSRRRPLDRERGGAT